MRIRDQLGRELIDANRGRIRSSQDVKRSPDTRKCTKLAGQAAAADCPEAARLLRIGRTKLYELINSGSVRTVKIDNSRRIAPQALHDYVAGLLTSQ